MSRTQIFTNQTTNGSSLVFLPIGTDPYQTNALPQLMIDAGALGTTQIRLEAQSPDGIWIPSDPVNDIWTGSDYVRITGLYENSAYVPLRLTITGATATTNVNAWVWECDITS